MRLLSFLVAAFAVAAFGGTAEAQWYPGKFIQEHRPGWIFPKRFDCQPIPQPAPDYLEIGDCPGGTCPCPGGACPSAPSFRYMPLPQWQWQYQISPLPRGGCAGGNCPLK